MVRLYIWGEAARYANYQRVVERAGGAVRFGGTPEGCDGLLLPGGGDLEPWRYGQKNVASVGLEPKRDAAELELLDWFTAARQPVLGICRGMQTINVYFGGTLLQDVAGHRAADGLDRLHRVHTAASPLRNLCGEHCIVNSAHHQAVDRLGAGLRAVQWTADGIVEAVCHDALPIWGLQWHPERLDGEMGLQVFRRFLDLCG